ncbi:MAG: YqgE/AlgH family protein [Rhodospirillales bacterium]|jgi:putative transcriptional regulator|nr:YqgE/AlgH family protein [Rhodospirillales bacterium]
MRRACRSILGLIAVLLLAAAGACAVEPPPTPVKPIIGKLGAETETRRGGGALTGQFLVATPRMEDPRFARTVILMISHDEKGAMGLVVNRAFGQGSLSQLLTGFGVTEYRRTESTVRLFYGGPVEPERGFVLHSGDYKGISTRRIDEHVSVSTGKDVLEAIAAGNGPAEAMFIIGYAGWSAGQLEREMARDDWLTAPGNPQLIFSEHPERTWGEVYREAGLVL